MITIKNITELDEIMTLISEQKYDSKINGHRSSFLYRGIPNADYLLETSLTRNCKKKLMT